MANPVQVTDLETRYRALSSGEQAVAEALLADAWAIMVARVPELEARLTAGTLSAELVTAVECGIVLRVLRNPEGKRMESIDDYSYTRDDTRAGGLLYLSVDELDLLSPDGATGSEAFTITPTGEPGYAVTLPLNYWELNL